jgi:predicted Rossmann-fold nucleotide-binding protein
MLAPTDRDNPPDIGLSSQEQERIARIGEELREGIENLADIGPAVSIFPGGFGTVDELFELLTLVQTGKLQQRPIVLVGSDYWRGLYQWLVEQPKANAFIGEDDLEYLQIVDDSDAAAAILLDYYRRECPEHANGG